MHSHHCCCAAAAVAAAAMSGKNGVMYFYKFYLVPLNVGACKSFFFYIAPFPPASVVEAKLELSVLLNFSSQPSTQSFESNF